MNSGSLRTAEIKIYDNSVLRDYRKNLKGAWVIQADRQTLLFSSIGHRPIIHQIDSVLLDGAHT